MTPRRSPRAALALAGALLALGTGGVVAVGHYRGAGWDAPLQHQARALIAALDLGSPSILLAALALALSALLFALALLWRARQPAALPDDDGDTAPRGRRVPVESGPALPAGVDAFTTVLYFDLENQSITAEHVPLFARGISGTLWGIAVERRVYADGTQHATALAALRAHGFTVVDLPHERRRQVVDKRMMLDVLARLLDAQAAQEQLHIILITADVDFVPLVRLLRFFGHHVSVWTRAKTAHNETARVRFQQAGAVVRHFDKFLTTSNA
ncbi:MAG TPA: NYN domain-containing protein [Ktedonobacterales bacterium]